MQLRSFTLILAPALLVTNLAAIGPAMADQFRIASDVAAVTVYPEGGTVTRTAGFSVPAGTHDLIIGDIPDNAILETLAVRIDGVTLSGVTHRTDHVPPRDAPPDPRVEAAKHDIETIEQRIADVRDEAARIRLAKEAAEIRIGFLNQLGRGEGLAHAGADTLRDLSRMVGEDALEARRSALDAEIAARVVERQMNALNEQLEKARQALSALDRENDDRLQLVLQVSAKDATEGTLSLDYLSRYDSMQWAPAYEFRLNRGDAAQIDIQRDVLIYQDTGENWDKVRLTLSTVMPSGQITPSSPLQKRRVIIDPKPVPAPARKLGTSADMAEPLAEPSVVVEESGALFVTDMTGLSVTYEYTEPVSLVSGADVVRLKLDQISVPAVVFAQAVPAQDQTAFVMARFTNESGEQLLPAEFAGRHLDGGFTGTGTFDGLPAGGEAELSFGSIDGLRLTHDVLDRNSGDRGFISKSNQQAVDEEFVVTNLTDEKWPVRVLGAVSYSEQDDLQIDWTATPTPSDTDVGKRRGILAWEFDLKAGGVQTIRLNTTMTWPEDMVLR